MTVDGYGCVKCPVCGQENQAFLGEDDEELKQCDHMVATRFEAKVPKHAPEARARSSVLLRDVLEWAQLGKEHMAQLERLERGTIEQAIEANLTRKDEWLFGSDEQKASLRQALRKLVKRRGCGPARD